MKIISKLPNTQSGVTPAVIKSALNVTKDGTNPKNIQSVNQFLQQYYSPSDLQTFFQDFNIPPKQVAKEVGPNEPSNPGLEANLDIQYIMAIAQNVPTWFISTGGTHEGQEPFLTWITTLESTPAPIPFVYSVSYGDVESSLTLAYTSRINVEFMKFGLRGFSIIFASGDDGVGCNNAGSLQQPNFPATSPYVTAVGGTVLINQDPLSIQSDSISSGGFSNYFPRASYQASTVANYLSTAKNLPPASFYNSSGRAFPDAAVFSENVIIVFGGGETYVGGTSCAAPVFSAIISLINDLRLTNGKATLGFLNPLLYTLAPKYPTLFYDIVSGPPNSASLCPGFYPTSGWDPITGWGVPNYPEFAKYLS